MMSRRMRWGLAGTMLLAALLGGASVSYTHLTLPTKRIV